MAELVNDRVDDPSLAGVDRYVGLEHLDTGALTISRWGSPSDVSATKIRFRPGDVIFGRRRAYQRKLGVADFHGICSAHAMVLRARPDRVVPRYLAYFMQSDLFMTRAESISVGSLSPTINWPALATQVWDVPPIPEQLRAVALLDQAAAAPPKHEELQRRIAAVELSLMTWAFGMSPETPPRRGARLVRLGEIAAVHSGIALGRRPAAASKPTPYLRVANVKDGELDLAEVKQIAVAESEVEHYRLRFGDVLMTEGGDLDKLGRGTVWQDELPLCLHQNHVFAVRLESAIDPWYLAALARSPFGRAYFLRCAKRTSNLASINKRQLEELPVPLLSHEERRLWSATYSQVVRSRNEVASRVLAARDIYMRVVNAVVR